ncbi:MAG: hypothetical protein KAS32_11840 [Candidatus Peribacteraceae bacterium]|nr:hypothetical protein [Candidatus Peribacteraceae bacterium]
MREILFKAQRVDGKGWVEGNIITNDGKPFIVNGVIESSEEYIALKMWCPVIPETVCQYIGLEARNGVPMFEGDYEIDRYAKGENGRMIVEFVNGGFVFVMSNGQTVAIKSLHGFVTISGNIHDLKVK